MGSKRRSSNVSIKIFRKSGFNRPFLSSNSQKGDVSIIALERGFIEKNTMESVRRVITRELSRSGKINIPLSFSSPVTSKPSGIRMGKGKGKISKYIARVSSGTILLEIFTSNSTTAIKALSKALYKLPIKAKIRCKNFL